MSITHPVDSGKKYNCTYINMSPFSPLPSEIAGPFLHHSPTIFLSSSELCRQNDTGHVTSYPFSVQLTQQSDLHGDKSIPNRALDIRILYQLFHFYLGHIYILCFHTHQKTAFLGN